MELRHDSVVRETGKAKPLLILIPVLLPPAYECLLSTTFYIHTYVWNLHIVICFIKLKERPSNFTFSYILKRNKPNSVLCLQCLEDQRSFQLSHPFFFFFLSHPFFVTIGKKSLDKKSLNSSNKTIFIKYLCNINCWLVKNVVEIVLLVITLNFGDHFYSKGRLIH